MAMLSEGFRSVNREALRCGADETLVLELSEDIGSFVRMLIRSMLATGR